MGKTCCSPIFQSLDKRKQKSENRCQEKFVNLANPQSVPLWAQPLSEALGCSPEQKGQGPRSRAVCKWGGDGGGTKEANE